MQLKKLKLNIVIVCLLLLITIKSEQITNQSPSQNLMPNSYTTKLPQLKTIPHIQMYHKIINISMGQQLTIVLPSFDSLYNLDTFKIKNLNNQEYQKSKNKLQQDNKQKQTDFQNEDQQDSSQNKHNLFTTIGKDAQLKNLPMKCQYIAPKAQVYQVISKINDQSGSSSLNYQNKLYVHVTSRQLLYILNVNNMLLSAYYYNDLNIKFLSSFQLPINLASDPTQQSRNDYQQSHPSVAMSLNSKQTELFVFSGLGIWVIQTKTYLTNIKLVSSLSGFSSSDSLGVDKIIRGSSSYLVAMKKMSSVFIIPQSNSQIKYRSIQKFHSFNIFPQDIAVQSSYLFILDVYNGVYVYRILPDGNVKQMFKIALDNYGGNFKLHLYQLDTLFVNFNDYDGSKVVEIRIDLERQKAELVRYFKNDDYISVMQTYSVLTSSTGFYLSQINDDQTVDMRQIRNSAEVLLFMISNYQQIQIFPFNVDPRTITSMYNGVKIDYPKAQQIFHIFGDRFIIMTQKTIDYIKISILKPQIRCLMGIEFNPSSSMQSQNLLLTTLSNISTCEYRNSLFPHKQTFSQTCLLTTSYLIHLNDPDQSSIRKMITYSVVLVVVVAFAIGLCCLVQWRNQKLIVLARLKDEILRFRNRHRRMQPFVEEQHQQHRQVQMEVPKDIQYIPNDDD